MAKIRLRFIIATLKSGGAETVLLDLLSKLDPNKYSVNLTTVIGGPLYNRLPKYVDYKQIVKSPVNSFISKVVLKLPKFIFCKLFMKGKNDIEIAYLEGTATDVIGALKTKAKKIAFVHMDPSKSDAFNKMYPSRKKCAELYGRFDKVCFVSYDAMDGFRSIYGSKCNQTVIHNVLDYNKIFSQSQKETDIIFKQDTFKIAVVGRITKEKRLQRVLYVANELKDKYDFQVIVVGSGDEYDMLMDIKNSNNIHNVIFAGYQENPYPIIKQADLLVSSSLFEGYSTVACEALALGVPVLTTDCAGMKEILQNGVLGVITENDSKALKEGLEELLSNSEKYAKIKKAAEEYAKGINHDNCIADYDNMFIELTKELNKQ